jgi:hypothetical protein
VLVLRALPALAACGALVAVLAEPGDAEAARRRRHRHADAGADAPSLALAADAAPPPSPAADAGADASDASTDRADPGCLYGRLIDGHTGEIRCLSPEEVAAQPDAAVPRADAAASASIDAAGDAGADAGGRATVKVASVTFEAGEVPRAERVLDRLAKKELAACVSGPREGRPGQVAQVTLSFLVRARGRAEGVEVDKVRGVSAEAARCMAQVLARRAVGAPSSDPVGVKVVFDVSRGP